MDWRRLSKRLLLSDGKITAREAEILREEVWADGRVTKDELEFLQEVRREARFFVSEEFDALFFDILRRLVLVDGTITDDEARWLRRVVFSDHTATEAETKFLKRLQRDASA